MQAIERTAGAGARGKGGGHVNAQRRVKAHCTEIEELVVQHAQRQSVVQGVWAVEREPAHVSGVDADRGTLELSVVPAERALKVPCPQDGSPPARVAPPFRHPGRVGYDVSGAKDHVRVEPDRGEDVGRDGGWEVALDESAGGGLD